MKTMKTYTTKPSHVEPEWLVFDAADKVLGRLATEVSGLLQGKHKPIYARNILTGDHVIVVNASRIKVTGNKLEQKLYRRHSHYPGGLRETPMSRMKENHPDRIFRAAVKGMLPKTILGRQMLSRLKIYAGELHPHGAQVKEMASEEILVAPVEIERPVVADVKVSEQPVEAVVEETTEAEVTEQPVDEVVEETAEAEVSEQPVEELAEEPAQAEVEEPTEESAENKVEN
jgi:large subunit ribosomal protein L13